MSFLVGKRRRLNARKFQRKIKKPFIFIEQEKGIFHKAPTWNHNQAPKTSRLKPISSAFAKTAIILLLL